MAARVVSKAKSGMDHAKWKSLSNRIRLQKEKSLKDLQTELLKSFIKKEKEFIKLLFIVIFNIHRMNKFPKNEAMPRYHHQIGCSPDCSRSFCEKLECHNLRNHHRFDRILHPQFCELHKLLPPRIMR